MSVLQTVISNAGMLSGQTWNSSWRWMLDPMHPGREPGHPVLSVHKRELPMQVLLPDLS